MIQQGAITPRLAPFNRGSIGKQHIRGHPTGCRSPGLIGAAQQSPRAQLFNSVRPGNTRAALMPAGVPTRVQVAPPRAVMAPHAMVRPAGLQFDSAHRIGRAGRSNKHTAFVFRHDGHMFRRGYYRHGDEWFWFDVPLR